jgi:hypothetical protein
VQGTVLIAAAACEMHPTALLKGISLRSVTTGLAQAGARALDAGVDSLPALAVHGEVFTGAGCVEAANRALASLPARS